MRARLLIALTAALLATAILLINGRPPAGGAPTGLAALRVPAGFRVERAAGAELIAYGMMGTLDDRGRLYVCQSSGNNVNNARMKANPEYRVRRLEDVDGDGVYDRSTVFAERLTLPAGAAWVRSGIHRGSLYVAAPPDLIRFTDANDDGVAESKEIVVTGWNMSSNAASLHGPILGPDGFLYLTDGRHGFDIATRDGKRFKGRSSRIWRVRPDGTGMEWVSGGGFDNPVEVVFTTAGDMFGTMTYFTDPKEGLRDAVLHFVEGGVYPKPHPTASEFKRTGDYMPVMTPLARVAPSGLAIYRGSAWGAEYTGSVFSAQFNPHKVQRHVPRRDGATFVTEDEDFLTSLDPDFHPTDVFEDADGSLLVIDTGAWFLHGCPLSRLSKPQIRGGVYRIRKDGTPTHSDPRGTRLDWKVSADVLAGRLEDRRPMVRDRAADLLVEAGDSAVPTLSMLRQRSNSSEARCAAVFALSRIATSRARFAVREALGDHDLNVRIAAARMSGMNQDRDAVGRLIEIVRSDEPAARRQAATALGQIGDASSSSALLDAATLSDRFLDHAAIYSLIGLRSAAVAQRALADSRPAARRAALIALDQMDGATLDRREAAALLSDRDPAVRGAALWVAAHHADWAPEILSKVRARLQSADWAEESDGLREILLTYSANPETQRFIAELLGSASEEQRGFALEVMDRSPVRDLPAAWVEKLVQIVEAQSGDLRVRALGIFRSRGIGGHDTLLTRLANDSSLPREERVLALSGLVTRRKALSRDEERFVIGLLDTAGDAALRQSGAQVLARATLSEDALNEIASKAIPAADALVLTHLLDAFAGARTQSVGLSLVRGLGKSDVVLGGSDAGKLEKILKAYPDAVRKAARPVLDRAAESERQRAEKLRELEPVLTAAGDVHAGRQVFFGEKTGCSGCHTIGKSGGDVGPDLTSIGAIRSGHDLLEAVVFPSATFVPGHEIYHVVTATETYAGVVRENEPGWVLVATGPREQIRVPRARVKSMRIAEVSIMPDGFDQVLSRKELGDLLAFLQSLKTPNQKPAQRAVFSRSR